MPLFPHLGQRQEESREFQASLIYTSSSKLTLLYSETQSPNKAPTGQSWKPLLCFFEIFYILLSGLPQNNTELLTRQFFFFTVKNQTVRLVNSLLLSIPRIEQRVGHACVFVCVYISVCVGMRVFTCVLMHVEARLTSGTPTLGTEAVPFEATGCHSHQPSSLTCDLPPAPVCP